MNADDTLYLEPDISVICDKGKLTDDGCKGSPDWIIEIVSTSSRSMDYVTLKLLAKYKIEEWVSFYNSYVQEHLMKELAIQPCVHMLDCAKGLVNLDNDHYENSSVVKIDVENMTVYQLRYP